MFRPSSATVGFDNEDTMMSKIHKECTGPTCNIMLAVSFTNLKNDGKSLPKTIKYTIRAISKVPGELHETAALFPEPTSAETR